MFDYAGLAHLVEQRYRKPQVVGSSPTAGSIPTTNSKKFLLYHKFNLEEGTPLPS